MAEGLASNGARIDKVSNWIVSNWDSGEVLLSDIT